MVEAYLNAQTFSNLKIYVSIAFVILFAGLLFYKRKYMTLLAGLCGSVFSVLFNYIIGSIMLKAYTISTGNMFLMVLATNMCYSFVAISIVWIILQKDLHTFEWCTFAIVGWILAPVISSAFSEEESNITLEYNSKMMCAIVAIMLAIGVITLIIYNIRQKSKQAKINIVYLLSVGVLVPLAHGIASNANANLIANLGIIFLNSLLSMTYLIPIIFILFLLLTSKTTEFLKPRKEPKTLSERIEEFNADSIIEKRKYDKKSYPRPTSSINKVD